MRTHARTGHRLHSMIRGEGETIRSVGERWRERWHRLCGWMALPAWSLAIGEDLLARHNAPGRHRHDASRVLRLLDALDRYPDRIDDSDAVELALWYAHAIHEPDDAGECARRRSAALFRRDFDGLAEGKVDIARVEDFILALRHRFRPASGDEAVVMDIDLDELAAPPDRYRLLRRSLTEEWSAARRDPEQTRLRRRREVEALLAREHLYFTNHYRKCFEDAARRNLFDELRDL